RVGDGHRGAGVAHGHPEGGVAAQRGARTDRQFLSLAPETGGCAVDGDLLHVEAPQVEVQGGEVLGRAGGDGGGAGQVVRAGVVGEVEVVVRDVVPAVARPGEVRVPQPGARGPRAGGRAGTGPATPARRRHHGEQGEPPGEPPRAAPGPPGRGGESGKGGKGGPVGRRGVTGPAGRGGPCGGGAAGVRAAGVGAGKTPGRARGGRRAAVGAHSAILRGGAPEGGAARP